jgi:hypothetical protein
MVGYPYISIIDTLTNYILFIFHKSPKSYIYAAIQGVELTFGEGDILLGLPYDVHQIHLARGAVSA